MSKFLPYGRQHITDDDVAAVVSVLRGDFLTTGPMVATFEANIARRVGAKGVSVCSSGTAALHLAVMALSIGERDAVIVPSVTFLATASMVRAVGAEVVFADVDPHTGLLGPTQLEAAIARGRKIFPQHRLRAAIPVHLAGQTCPLAELQAIASRHGLAVIEDACHALGTIVEASDGDSLVGDCRWSDMACFSFHPLKAIAMGEGGAVTCRDPGHLKALNRLRSHGMVREPADFEQRERGFDAAGLPNPWYYEMPEIGFNYRASDILCALGNRQLDKLDEFVAVRRSLADHYRRLMLPLANLVTPIRQVPGCRAAWHLFAVQVDFAALGLTRSAVMRALQNRGIGSQVHYIPVHTQPYYRRRYGDITLPAAEQYYERTLSLPLFVGMTETDVEHVVDSLSEILAQH
jgi:UDP-4-amino-4,6-dideoxy-N-acetyl-beta-L-altrosamine transaminase